MHQILLLNPNTSSHITTLMAQNARQVVGPDIAIVEVTATFGPSYIGSQAAGAIATHAALDTLAHLIESDTPVDMGVVACFGFQGLGALQEIAPFPLISLLDASVSAALMLGNRFSILTGGERWVPMLRTQVQQMGLANRLASVRSIPLLGDDIAREPEQAIPLLTDLANMCVQTDGADCVILGGAGLTGLAQSLQPQVSVPLIDNLIVTIATAEMLLKAGLPAQQPTCLNTSSVGLSAPLSRRLALKLNTLSDAKGKA